MNNIKSLIKKIYWKYQVVKTRKPFYNEKYSFDDFNKILIIVPHADDELIGCYHLITQYLEKITLLFCDYTGSNLNIKNKRIREQEFINFCMSKNIHFIISTDLQGDITYFLNSTDTDLILLTSLIDWHEEHRKINLILNKCLHDSSYNGLIGWYQISVPLAISNLGVYFSKKEKKKMEEEFYSFYPSQNNLPIERFNINRLFKINHKLFYIENYYVFNKYKFVIMNNHFHFIDLEQIFELKGVVNSLNNIYAKSSLLYKSIDVYEK